MHGEFPTLDDVPQDLMRSASYGRAGTADGLHPLLQPPGLGSQLFKLGLPEAAYLRWREIDDALQANPPGSITATALADRLRQLGMIGLAIRRPPNGDDGKVSADLAALCGTESSVALEAELPGRIYAVPLIPWTRGRADMLAAEIQAEPDQWEADSIRGQLFEAEELARRMRTAA
ncbi:hypothetical protein [Solimonas sp. SE-A11]|uniref:hypothetical protein n=1 Tax=Solimonas sp. SE-A11 TaxID=3054954 RepID=UPI00259D12E6|nr:hypothetical protein [Solimonas sp. SE-A11]MDM4770847.1 hypothetical protein [Solimonas sp. SE-A11]